MFEVAQAEMERHSTKYHNVMLREKNKYLHKRKTRIIRVTDQVVRWKWT